MRRVLVVMPYGPSSFMEDDLEILSRHAQVSTIRGGSAISIVARARQELAHRRPDAVLLWFAHPTYAWIVIELARRYGATSAVVTGGYDVASMPGMRFGLMRKPHYRFLVRRALERADGVLPFSERAAAEVRQWAKPRRLRVVYPGVDTEVFRPAPGLPRERLIVTASMVNHVTVRQKGLDTFIEVARRIPDARFVLVGRSGGDEALARLRAQAPDNVEFITDYVPRQQLVRLFQSARAYLQPSAHEGFGLAVAEAMACGAIGVGTRETSLAEVIGDAGYLVPFDDLDGFVEAARRALAGASGESQRARDRIVSRFTLERRERELLGFLTSFDTR